MLAGLEGEVSLVTKKTVRKLEQYCSNIVAELPDHQLQHYLERYMEKVDDQKRNKLLNSSSSKYLNFPLNLSLLLFTSEKYWRKRCFEKNWTLVHYWFYFCNWKSTFVSRYAEELIDKFIFGDISFSELEISLLRFKDYLFTLKINGYKLKYVNCNFKKFTAENGNILLEDYILRIISMFPLLKELYFNNIPINYELAFDLDKNCFNDSSIERLGDILSTRDTLQKVSFFGTYLNHSQFCEMLRSLRLDSLVDLNLSCNLISDDVCENIAELLRGSNIQKLILSNNCIGNAGAKHLSRILPLHKSLDSLYLDQNVIEDDGIIFLAEAVINSSVLKLDISHNKFTGNATEIFHKLLLNSSLEYLNLAGNYLGKEAGSKIYSAVKFNKGLRFFGYQFCGFSQDDEDDINLSVAQNYTESQP